MPAVHLVRHGRSTWNDEGRIQGWTPHPPLTALGREQARDAAEHLRPRVAGDALLISSDLTRAVQTAQIIGAVLGLDLTSDERLREQCLGHMQGCLPAQLGEEDGPPGVPIEEVRWAGGESLLDVHTRLADFFAREWTCDLIVVTHGDALRVALAVLDGRTHRQLDWSVPIENGSVHTRTING